MLGDAWSNLVRGVRDGKHGFHLPVVATVQDGLPRARVVVLRGASSADRTLAFHTDARSAKLDELDAGIAWTFYDQRRRLQVRARGDARVADPDTVAARWGRSPATSRKCYLVEPAPGTPVDAWASGYQGHLDGPVVPSLDETESGRENFTVVESTVTELELLYTLRQGHQRARWRWQAGWQGSWLIP